MRAYTSTAATEGRHLAATASASDALLSSTFISVEVWAPRLSVLWLSRSPPPNIDRAPATPNTTKHAANAPAKAMRNVLGPDPFFPCWLCAGGTGAAPAAACWAPGVKGAVAWG